MHFNTHGVKYDELGSNRPLPGTYHVVISDAGENATNDGRRYIQVDMAVLNGTVPGQEGRTLTEFFHLSGKQAAMDRLVKFLLAAKIVGENEEKDVNFKTDAPGKQLVVECEADEYQGKKRIKLSFGGFWPVDHPDVKDIPKGTDMLKLSSPTMNIAVSTAQAAAPKAAGATTEAKDAWADL